MTPDREMDRLISETFGFAPEMSWHALNEDESATCMSFESEIEGRDWLRLKQAEYPSYFSQYHVGSWKRYPAFSTDPADSKLLRDKLAETHTWILSSPGRGCEHFYFGMTVKGCLIKGYEAEGDTEELAVALCALKSVGLEVPLVRKETP